jgi:hypothetical protein
MDCFRELTGARQCEQESRPAADRRNTQVFRELDEKEAVTAPRPAH